MKNKANANVISNTLVKNSDESLECSLENASSPQNVHQSFSSVLQHKPLNINKLFKVLVKELRENEYQSTQAQKNKLRAALSEKLGIGCFVLGGE